MSRLLTRRARFIAMFTGFCVLSCALIPLLGRDFFPAVDAGGRVNLRPVRIGRDLGEAVEIVEGITEQDTVVLNPPDSLADGDVVTVVTDHGPSGT